MDTHETIPVGEGTITKARISAVKKGVEGEPGEIEGSLTSTVLGEIQLNSANGVYGTIVNSESLIQTQNAIPIALKEEIKEGKAYILCNLEGDTVEQYEVKVSKTSKIASKNDGLVVEITDPRLLEKTNGIHKGDERFSHHPRRRINRSRNTCLCARTTKRIRNLYRRYDKYGKFFEKLKKIQILNEIISKFAEIPFFTKSSLRNTIKWYIMENVTTT